MKYKTQALQTFKKCFARYGPPKIWRTYEGTEYKNEACKKYCISEKIAREITVSETLDQNGFAERFNRTVVEAARYLLIDSKLPKRYWVRAVDTACYSRKLVVKVKNTKLAFKNFFGCEPRNGPLKIFGCIAYSKKPLIPVKINV